MSSQVDRTLAFPNPSSKCDGGIRERVVEYGDVVIVTLLPATKD